MDKDIAFLLEEWARWRWVGHGAARGLPTMTTFRALLGSTVRNPVISDDLACAVDAAVSEVCAENEKLGRALVQYFLKRRSYRQIGKKWGCSHSTAGALVQAGVAAVGEKLEG